MFLTPKKNKYKSKLKPIMIYSCASWSTKKMDRRRSRRLIRRYAVVTTDVVEVEWFRLVYIK